MNGLIREIASVRDLADEFKRRADAGELIGAVVMVIDNDRSFDVAWNGGAGAHRIGMVGCIEFLKRDLMAEVSAVGE